MAEEVGRPHGYGQYGEGEYDQEAVEGRPAEHPAGVFAPPVVRGERRQAGGGFEGEGCAEDVGGYACQQAAQRYGQPAFLPVFQQGVEDDGAEDDDKGDMRHVETARPFEELFHLSCGADEAEVEQQAAADAVTRQFGHQAAAFGNAEYEAEYGNQDAEGQRVAAGGHHDGDKRDERAVRAGQVGRGQEEAGQQQDKERGNQQFVAHVFKDEAVGQAQGDGKGRRHRAHHHDFAYSAGHRGDKVFPFEAVVAQR